MSNQPLPEIRVSPITEFGNYATGEWRAEHAPQDDVVGAMIALAHRVHTDGIPLARYAINPDARRKLNAQRPVSVPALKFLGFPIDTDPAVAFVEIRWSVGRGEG